MVLDPNEVISVPFTYILILLSAVLLMMEPSGPDGEETVRMDPLGLLRIVCRHDGIQLWSVPTHFESGAMILHYGHA